MSLLVDQWVPEGTCSQVLRSTSVDSWSLRASKFSVLKLIEIVILWVYYTIPFGFSFVLALSGNHFNFWNNFVWLRITDEGSLPEMRIWSILLIKSVLKWWIHLSRILFYYYDNPNDDELDLPNRKIPINILSLPVQPSALPSLYPFFLQSCLHILSKVFRSTAKQPTVEVGWIRCGFSRI